MCGLVAARVSLKGQNFVTLTDKLEQESSEFKDAPNAYLKYETGKSGLLEWWT